MKKYITASIATLITLAVIGMITGQSQASGHQQFTMGSICYQQNPGIKIRPAYKGSGEVGRCIKCSRCGGKGIVRGNYMLP